MAREKRRTIAPITREAFFAPVLIIGVGPVGLALAHDPGQRGVGGLVVERSTARSALLERGAVPN